MTKQAIHLIVGLGNPGHEYAMTRHNLGAWFVESLGQSFSFQKRFHGNHAQLEYPPHRYHLLNPTTFMNHSGRAVKAIAHYYKIPMSHVLVVHDELDLAPGVLRFKQGGGAGGHNGLKDIMTACADNSFWRLRIGIGHPAIKQHVARYVLNRPNHEEQENIQALLFQAKELLPLFLEGEMQGAMQRLHSIC